MNEVAIESENITKPAASAQPKRSRKSKGKQTKKTAKAKKVAKSSTDRANKKPR